MDNSRSWDMGTLVDYEMMAPLWNIVWLTFKKIRNKLLYYPAIPLLSINIQKLEAEISDIFTPIFIAALFMIFKK